MKWIEKIGKWAMLLLFLAAGTAHAQSFDKHAFYQVFKSGDLARIDQELEEVRAASFPEKDAYEGVLLMKKAGLVSRPAEKLRLFKSGRIHFGGAILNDSLNAEYRFLRLAIQEHAPKVAKYAQDKQRDAAFVSAHFNSLPSFLQEIVRDYAKSSASLHREDLH